ncbi:MFS transporter, partial [Streptomyces benahoarensis]
ALALGGVTYALIAAPERGLSAGVVVPGVAGLLLGAAFVAVERRRAEPMLPPELFAIRQFSAVNAVTVCVYAAFSGFFFLAVVQLQVVAGYSALAAGTALLPTTVLMLLLSARSGELGQRIGPRIPLTVGPLLCAVGMLLMTRVGAGASYVVDVLPALVVLGAGMVTLVAPLTATVLASVDVDRAGLASGINNAAARAAGLVAIAALPLLAGMGPQAYRSADAFAVAFRRAMPWCAGVLLVGAVIACVAVRTVPAVPEEQEEQEEAGAPEAVAAPEAVGAVEAAGGASAAHEGARHGAPCHPECTYHCGVGAPPLDPGDVEVGRPSGAGAPPGPGAPSGPGAEAGGPERPGP